MRGGWADRLLSDGEEPDPRFTLANERTFLAWIRTSLALIAAGLGLEAFVTDEVLPDAARRTLAVLLVLAGGLLSAAAFRRWLVNEQAIRRHRPLPPPTVAPVLAYGVAVVAGLVLVLLVVA